MRQTKLAPVHRGVPWRPRRSRGPASQPQEKAPPWEIEECVREGSREGPWTRVSPAGNDLWAAGKTNPAPPPATDWDAPAPYKGNLAMLLQAMIATEDGPAAALAASMMAETNTPMAPPEALVP